MAGLLGVCMLVVVVFCLARSVVPSLRPPDHRLALDAWHVVMGLSMAAMLLTPLSRTVSVVALGVFAVGLGASSFQAVAHRAGRAAYVRLGVGCAAMAAMLAPAAASAAPAASVPPAGHQMHGMHGMHGADAAAAAGSTTVVPPTVLVAALVALVGVVLVARLLGALRASEGRNARLDAWCDVAMAGAMGYMLLLMI